MSAVLGVSLIASLTLAYGFWRRWTLARRALVAAEQRLVDGRNLLATIVEAAPISMVLLRETGSVVFANPAARELLFAGSDPVGQDMLAMVAGAPPPFRDAMLGDDDALFTVG